MKALAALAILVGPVLGVPVRIAALLILPLLTAGLATAQCLLGPLEAPDSVGGSQFGGGLAVSGSTIFVGDVSNNTPPSENAIYERNGPGFERVFEFPTPLYAIDIEGDTAVGITLAGDLVVFERGPVAWSLADTICLPSGVSITIDIASTEDTLVIGQPLPQRCLVFERMPGGFQATQQLTTSDGLMDTRFGISVAVEGDTIAVGADLDDDMGTDAGAVYFFERGPAGWEPNQKIYAGDPDAQALFGNAAALAGERLAVGAFEHLSRGALYVFRREPSDWVEEYRLLAPTASPDPQLGRTVAIDEDRAMVGLPGHSQAWVMTRTGTDWIVTQVLDAPESVQTFGSTVELSNELAAVSAPGGHLDAGQVFAYSFNEEIFNYCITSPNSVGAGATIGWEGSASLAANDLVLTVDSAPPGVPGLFITNQMGQAGTILGNGVLCIGLQSPGPFRLWPTVAVDGSGRASRALDLTASPFAGLLTPCSTWRFQFWYRDAGSFNFSDGLRVLVRL